MNGLTFYHILTVGNSKHSFIENNKLQHCIIKCPVWSIIYFKRCLKTSGEFSTFFKIRNSHIGSSRWNMCKNNIFHLNIPRSGHITILGRKTNVQVYIHTFHQSRRIDCFLKYYGLSLFMNELILRPKIQDIVWQNAYLYLSRSHK